MKKYIILVAGYDYANSGVDFAYIADKRKNYLLKQNPGWQTDAGCIFIRINTKTGSIERNLSDNRAGWVVEATPYEAIRRSVHYRNNQFVPSENRILSIEDCYAYTARLGTNEPGSVKELSFLGHGWFEGPILVNSFQRQEYITSGSSPLLRDPWDKDGRSKDFFSQNMEEAAWTGFRNAFAPDGYCWVWGCLFPRAYYNILYTVVRSAAYRSKAPGSHTDDQLFPITVSQSFASDHYATDPRFFPSSTSERSFSRSLRDIKLFVKRGILRCYPGRFALDNGIHCRAAYLGVYADYERASGNIRSNETVMIIPRNRETYTIDFSDIIQFYKAYLGLQEDPENRGYGIYTGAQAHTWWNETTGS